MNLAAIIAAFMLSVGSPTWVVNHYASVPAGIEVDVQTTTNPARRYLLLIGKDGIVDKIQVPLDEAECQKETP